MLVLEPLAKWVVEMSTRAKCALLVAMMCCHPRPCTWSHGSWFDRNGNFFRDAIIRWIQYRGTIRNQHYFNIRMYRICEYYDVYVSYFVLSFDIIFNIYNKNDIFEPKWKITITLIYDHQTYTSDASDENKYFSRRSMHLILSGRDQIAKSNR